MTCPDCLLILRMITTLARTGDRNISNTKDVKRTVFTPKIESKIRRVLGSCIYAYLKCLIYHFSNSRIIHKVETEKITTVKVVWIPGLN